MNDNNFLHLKAGYNYYLSYNRWKTVLLPPPYLTNCKNYDLDDKHDYKFRTDCVNHCIYDGLSRECADLSIDKTYDWKDCLEKTDLIWRRESFNNSLTDIKLCQYWKDIIQEYNRLEDDKNDTSFVEIKSKLSRCRHHARNKISTKCEIKCQPECYNRFYNYDLKSQIPSTTTDQEITVKIVDNQMPDQIVENIPEMSFITFVCDFGGLLGMWLGLSAMALLHYFIKLI